MAGSASPETSFAQSDKAPHWRFPALRSTAPVGGFVAPDLKRRENVEEMSGNPDKRAFNDRWLGGGRSQIPRVSRTRVSISAIVSGFSER